MSRIVKFEAENVKRLKAVTITPNGAVVTIRGANGACKSSVLDAIEYTLAGEKSHPAEPIRRGTERARIVLETDDGIVVERRFSAGGTRLEVRNKDGAKFGSPQKLLDSLVGKLSFDPLGFLREKPQRQAEIVREVSGVDLSVFDGHRQKIYDERTEVNRQVAATKARLDSIPLVVAPGEEVSAADLLEEQNRRQEIFARNEQLRAELRQAGASFTTTKRTIEVRTDEVKDLEERLAEAVERLSNEEHALEQIREAGKKLKEEAGAQVWLEIVGKGGVGVVIEDGEVALSTTPE